MHDLQWSRGEKVVARAAYDAALAREMASIREEAEAILRRSADPFDVWDVHDFLSRKKREIEGKYDYRYSVLIWVFAQLLREGWARESELAGLSTEKLEIVRRCVTVMWERAAGGDESAIQPDDAGRSQRASEAERSRHERDRA